METRLQIGLYSTDPTISKCMKICFLSKEDDIAGFAPALVRLVDDVSPKHHYRGCAAVEVIGGFAAEFDKKRGKLA